MPRRRINAEQFYFTRREIVNEFEKPFERTKFCKQCKKCINCTRAEYVDFEVDRKMFYTSNKDVKKLENTLARENKKTCNFTSVLALCKLL